MAPVFHVPSGTITLPPPALLHAAMARLMAFWLTLADAVVFAPYFVMGNSASLSVTLWMLFSSAGYSSSHTHANVLMLTMRHIAARIVRKVFMLFSCSFLYCFWQR